MTTLVAGIGHCPSETASTLSDRLIWIKEQVDRVKATNPRIGFDWGLFSWPHWQEEIVQSRADIEAMSLAMLNSSVKESKNT